MQKTMKTYKDLFLDQYNPDRTIDKALSRGIAASVQYNSLYSKDAPPVTKNRVRDAWCGFLRSLKNRYTVAQSVGQYEKDVEELKRLMNEHFANAFRATRHPKFKTDPGFRISHAQKSISVFLKHLWCMGLVATPPQCPVDRIILGKAGRRYPDTKWGYVNTIEEHRVKISYLTAAKNDLNQSLAEWELEKFEV